MTNNDMTPEAKAEKNRYMKEWYRKHPGKHQEYQSRYWKKKAAARRQQSGQEGGCDE